jgi:hypothetical protein
MSDRKTPRVRPPRSGGRMDRSAGPTPGECAAAERLVVTTADHEEHDYCTIGYTLTLYGYVPTANWDKYVAATEGDDR